MVPGAGFEPATLEVTAAFTTGRLETLIASLASIIVSASGRPRNKFGCGVVVWAK